MSQIAKKDSWETRPFSLGKTVTLPLSKSLTKGEFEELKKGVIPREMEDKWFVYYDEGFVYFHRSWTGILIYKIKVDQCKDGENVAILTQVEVNNDPDEYKPRLDPIKEHLVDPQARVLQSVSRGVAMSITDEDVENEEIREALNMVAWVTRAGESTSFLGGINQYLRNQK